MCICSTTLYSHRSNLLLNILFMYHNVFVNMLFSNISAAKCVSSVFPHIFFDGTLR